MVCNAEKLYLRNFHIFSYLEYFHLLGGFGQSAKATGEPLDMQHIYFLTEFDGIIVWPKTRGEDAFRGCHEQGRNLNKRKAFDDFIDAAKYLIKNGYTEAKKIVIFGLSHGGLLVASCINKAPELFGCAIAENGLMDMVRYSRSGSSRFYTDELGDPVNNKTEFENILKYSPLHTIREPTSSANQYPSTLILANKNDERVPIFHSLKYVAALQYATKNNKYQTNPILLKVHFNVGHLDRTSMHMVDELIFMHKSIKISSLTAAMSKMYLSNIKKKPKK